MRCSLSDEFLHMSITQVILEILKKYEVDLMITCITFITDKSPEKSVQKNIPNRLITKLTELLRNVQLEER